jgi:DNA-binding response OmpR family regulator
MRGITTDQVSKPIVFLKSGLSGNFDDLTKPLLSAGYPVEVFCTDDIDFAEIALLNPGLFLFDIHSTQLNELDFWRKLKKNPHLTKIPVLAVSDTCDEQTTELVFQLGASDLICMPFQKNEVLFRIKRHYMGQGSQEHGAEQSASINEARLESLLAINEYPTDSIQELLDFTLNSNRKQNRVHLLIRRAKAGIYAEHLVERSDG